MKFFLEFIDYDSMAGHFDSPTDIRRVALDATNEDDAVVEAQSRWAEVTPYHDWYNGQPGQWYPQNPRVVAVLPPVSAPFPSKAPPTPVTRATCPCAYCTRERASAAEEDRLMDERYAGMKRPTRATRAGG